jgi:NADPH:quinone reductase-like Zn-dependent oxidoreductase
MKAIRFHQYGGVENLQFEDIPVPQLTKGQVLVRVRAASINPIDIKLAAGMKRPVLNNKAVDLPWIPGCEFSGTVESVAEDIAGIQKGDEVFGNTPSGGSFAEFVLAQPDLIAPRPKKLNQTEAASVPLVGQTAWQALFEYGKLQGGQKVLIHGAAGGVGSFAVQLAHWKKAAVLATGSSDNTAYLRSLGADVTIDYKATPFESVAKDIDVVIDLIGGETQERSFKVLKPGGYLISTVSVPSQQMAGEYKVHAAMVSMKPTKNLLIQLVQLLDAGVIKTTVGKIYPFSQAKEAWNDIASHHTQGKIVLEMF